MALGDLGMAASTEETEAVLQKYVKGDEDELDIKGFNRLVADLQQHQRTASRKRAKGPMRAEYLPHEHKVRAFYQTKTVTIFFATLIIGNFAINCIEKEVDPGTGVDRTQNSPQLWQVRASR